MDRIFSEFPKNVLEQVKKSEFSWLATGENHDYISDEVMHVTSSEINGFVADCNHAHLLFWDTMAYIIKHKKYGELSIPENIIPLIEYTWRNNHEHLIGRFDFAGGLDNQETKILEYNADTPTMLPESSAIQGYVNEELGRTKYKGQFNKLIDNLEFGLRKIMDNNPDRHPSLLVTSLGYIEDQLNAQIIVEAALGAGIQAVYADLQDIEFSDDGVFLETENGEFTQFDFVYKFVPWEFIAKEEPDLMAILTRLVTQEKVRIINPAYSLIMQSKGIMKFIYDMHKTDPMVLKTTFTKADFFGKPYVAKKLFGRLGEDISIYDVKHNIMEKSEGNYSGMRYVYQEFTNLYRDDEGYYHQASVYYSNKKPCCLSFRSNQSLIMDDDSDFVPHIIDG